MFLYANDVKLAETVALKALFKGRPCSDIHGHKLQGPLTWEPTSGVEITILPLGTVINTPQLLAQPLFFLADTL